MILVTSSPLPPPAGVDVVEVETAAEMAESRAEPLAADAHVVVMAAAVADYTPSAPAAEKLKKSDEPLTLELVPTLDILADARRSQARRARWSWVLRPKRRQGTKLVELGPGQARLEGSRPDRGQRRERRGSRFRQ